LAVLNCMQKIAEWSTAPSKKVSHPQTYYTDYSRLDGTNLAQLSRAFSRSSFQVTLRG